MKLEIKRALLVTALGMTLLLSGCSSAAERNYQAGEELLAKGAFEEAAGKFSELGSYEEASRLLMYSRAALAGENGAYETAFAAFRSLGDFQDAARMLQYYEGRAAESEGQNALAQNNENSGLSQLKSAADIYGRIPGFRDAAEREAACLRTLYERGEQLLSAGRYPEASAFFESLGDWEDSALLKRYCAACLLEKEGKAAEAAERFAALGSFRDAGARADINRDLVYQQAAHLMEQADYENAEKLFSTVSTYRDAAEQARNCAVLLVGASLKSGSYEGAMFQLDAVIDSMSLEEADESVRQNLSGFLDEFVGAYLHFSSGSMEPYAGYNGVLPYIDGGGELDRRLRQVLMIGSYSHNTYFNYYGSELLELLCLGGDFYIACVRATASVCQPVGPVEVTRTFRILVRCSDGRATVCFLEDRPYGESGADGRMIVTGPLENGELPPDDDGDGIIVVDVMKKGFNGTMIIVLDPSRVFVGMPEFYGGNGMLLEDLVRRYQAVGGINGGGFIDEGGGGSGGLPEGLTIVGGEIYDWVDSGACAAFDGNNVLHVGYYSRETAVEMGIRDCVSFGPALVIDGVGEYGDYMESGINPRTAIGQRTDGAVLMLCIDGRQLHSIGASFGDIRDVMLDFGAVNACSLDGGSSTVMYLDGQYLNSPSSASGTSRYLPNAFLIR
ncbi:MAG: phosphodiester glycosidase family protein [Oscillospiraceae bacterium]|nr:phosphodiester glycosidase family protein [Oscillospiraceae bacterium]